MSSFLRHIRQAWRRRKVRRVLEKWKNHHSIVDGDVISRHYDLNDIYVDLYWYATFNGSKREVLYTRNSFSNFKKHLYHLENERLPLAYRAYKKDFETGSET